MAVLPFGMGGPVVEHQRPERLSVIDADVDDGIAPISDDRDIVEADDGMAAEREYSPCTIGRSSLIRLTKSFDGFDAVAAFAGDGDVGIC